MQSSQMTAVLEVSNGRIVETLKEREISLDKAVSVYSEKSTTVSIFEDLVLE